METPNIIDLAGLRKKEGVFTVFVGDTRCYLCFCAIPHSQNEHDAEIARPKPIEFDWDQIARDQHNLERTV